MTDVAAMPTLDDDSLDARAKAIIAKKREAPSRELFERAMLLEEHPSPAMLRDTASWLAIVDDLAEAGFTPEQILRLALRVDKAAYGAFRPDAAILNHLFAIDGGLAIARETCEDVLARGRSYVAWDEKSVVNAALARLAKNGAIEPRFESLFDWQSIEPTEMRAIVASLPAERREDFVLSRATPSTGPDVDTARSAAFILDKLLWLTDLVPAARARFDSLLTAAKSDHVHPELAAEVAANTPRTLEPRPTKAAIHAMDYMTTKAAKAVRATDINSIAASAYTRRIRVDAPELSTVAAWKAASAKRQKQVATVVAETLGGYTEKKCKVVDIASFGGPPIAVIACGKQRFCLVPGGMFEMGFSEEEEAAVRAVGEVNADRSNHFELYEQLFEQLSDMRPLIRVRVGPMLVEQGPGKNFDLDVATDALQDSLFRVPSEAEWEYCARGTRSRELTYRGDVVPDNEDWFEDTLALGVTGANAFGLWGFGYEMELCADAWHETLDDHPLDGTPRRGTGDRVVRGGAAQLYPWQGCGEWHMLLSAFRMPSSAAEFTIALRFVLGIDCAR